MLQRNSSPPLPRGEYAIRRRNSLLKIGSWLSLKARPRQERRLVVRHRLLRPRGKINVVAPRCSKEQLPTVYTICRRVNADRFFSKGS